MKAKKMEKNSKSAQPAILKAASITAGLIAIALGIIFLSSYILPQMQFIEDMRNGEFPPQPHERDGFAQRPPQEFGANSEVGTYMLIRLALSAINVLIVVWLLFVYVNDYLKFRTGFALGLVAFLFSFLLYALSSLPLVHMLFGFRGFGGVFSFIPMLFSAIGLVIFTKLSNE